LTYLFVGGGYAGLEALAELQDFAADALAFYPRASLHGMRWVLLEAADRVLPEIDSSLADYALAQLRGRGIDIRLGTTVEEVGSTFARLSTGEAIPTRTVVWTAGVTPHPSVRSLGLPLDERRRIPVDEELRVEGEQDVWAVGDSAAVPDPARPGLYCPPTSQHAIRQGRTAGRNIAASLGRGASAPFTYKTKGQFVNLGRYKAVARVGGLTLRGFPAWWLARSYHVSQIPGRARKVRAVMDWTVGLPFGRDIAEVGSIGHPAPLRSDDPAPRPAP
jgi:NADH:ubiquinone reductase (H+-translocating)